MYCDRGYLQYCLYAVPSLFLQVAFLRWKQYVYHAPNKSKVTYMVQYLAKIEKPRGVNYVLHLWYCSADHTECIRQGNVHVLVSTHIMITVSLLFQLLFQYVYVHHMHVLPGKVLCIGSTYMKGVSVPCIVLTSQILIVITVTLYKAYDIRQAVFEVLSYTLRIELVLHKSIYINIAKRGFLFFAFMFYE